MKSIQVLGKGHRLQTLNKKFNLILCKGSGNISELYIKWMHLHTNHLVSYTGVDTDPVARREAPWGKDVPRGVRSAGGGSARLEVVL